MYILYNTICMHVFVSSGYLACYSSGRWCTAEPYKSRWRPGLSWRGSGLCLLHPTGKHITLQPVAITFEASQTSTCFKMPF